MGEESSIGVDCTIYPYVVIEDNVRIADRVTLFHGAILGKPPKVAGVIARKPEVEFPTTTIGLGTVIGAHAVIYAGAQIGANCLIGDGVTVRENTIIGDESVVGSNSTIQNGARIGKRVKIVDLSHITFDCVIGDESFISVGVYTMNDNSMQRGGEVIGPKIGERARVGGGALLLPGVHIGDDAVVGAGSVVTHDVAPEARVMGVPAKTRAQEVSKPFDESFYEFPGGWPSRPYSEWPPKDD
jgi:acetyltransferase-like isoleucine patch superfamily enzyme